MPPHLKKVTPLSQQHTSKNEDPAKPPPPSPPSFLKFDKFGSSLNPPPSSQQIETGGAHYAITCFDSMKFLFLDHNQIIQSRSMYSGSSR